jgi:hypothetical protein
MSGKVPKLIFGWPKADGFLFCFEYRKVLTAEILSTIFEKQ